VTTTVLANQAAIGASLANIMAGAGVETMPAMIYNGCKLGWMSEGAKQILPQPLVKIERVPLRIGRIQGFHESVEDGFVEGAERPSKDGLEGTDFFRRWRSLQERVNRVPSGDQGDFKLDYLQAAVWRQKSAGVRGRTMARGEYERYAEGLERDGDHTGAFLIWELAMACPDPISPDRYIAVQRKSAAIALLKSIPDNDTEFDPISLRLARGLLYSFGVDDRRIYNSMLLKASEYNEAVGRLLEAAEYRMRIVHSIMADDSLDRSGWETVSGMIDSAVTLFDKSKSESIDTVELVQLGIDALGLAEVA
jgi:hypothetical protein